MGHAEKAKAFFDRGYNCCQSVLMAYAEELGLSGQTAAKIAGTFGGGMGRTGNVCGCVAAMCMVQGLRDSSAEPDKTAQQAANAGYREKMNAFEEAFESIQCRELLPAAVKKGPGPDGSRPCWIYVWKAAELLEDL